MSYDLLHEAKDVWLTPTSNRSSSEFWEALPACGLESEDDIFVFSRTDRFPIWQSGTIASAYIYCNGQEVYEPRRSWDVLKLRYLLATLPAKFAEYFASACGRVADTVGIGMVFEGSPVSERELLAMLDSCVRDLREKVGEPGSEDVAMTIEATYPRRRL